MGFQPPMMGGPRFLRQAIQGYTPQQLRVAYNLPSTGGSGTIAIVDAFNDPTALNDFNTFARQFGLPVETSPDVMAASNTVFQVVFANGTKPSTDAGWAGEESLDIEWAHAMAPGAKIVLVETTDNSFVNLYNGVNVAKRLPGVRQQTNSWGGGESSNETSNDSAFIQPGVVFFASTGDAGAERSYPALSSNVVAAGGTTLVLDAAGHRISESAWASGGGGPSQFIARPAFQNSISTVVGSKRGVPDISFNADPATGVAVFDTTGSGGWVVVGGTSLSSPALAGIDNLSRHAFNNSVELNNQIYNNWVPAGTIFRDITSGSNGFSAGPGWDFASGWGVWQKLVFPNPVAHSFPPTAVAFYQGQTSVGGLSGILAADGVNYTVVSKATAGLGQISGLTTDFVMNEAPNLIDTFTLKIKASGPANGTGQVFLFNWTTNTFDFLRSYPLSGTSAETDIQVGNFATYLKPGTGQFRILNRAIFPTRGLVMPSPFSYGVDWMNITTQDKSF
jgi:subtilase family serine protease